MSEDFNYLTGSNNAKILSCSSQANNCQAINILSSEYSSIWLTDAGLPQNVKIDLSKLNSKPSWYKSFGIYCWHAYNTNPKLIEIYFSKDNVTYTLFGKFSVALKIGNQFFNFNNPIDAKKNKYIKIVIKETYGGQKTYLNQVFLYDDIVENKYTNESINLITNENKTDEENNYSEPINTESENPSIAQSPRKNNINDYYNSPNTVKIKSLMETNSKSTATIKKLYKERRESFENNSYNIKNRHIIESKNDEDEKRDEDRLSTPNNEHNRTYNKQSVISYRKEDERNYKTLDDQLKDMENNLLRLKIDQKFEKRAMTTIDKEKNSFCSDANKGKNINISNHLSNLIDNSVLEIKKQTSNSNNINFNNLNIPFSHHISRNDYNINNHIDITNQNKIGLIEDKLNKLENDIVTLNMNFEKLLENVSKLVDLKNNFNEQNMNYILSECKKYIHNYIESNNKQVLHNSSQKNTIDIDNKVNQSIKKHISDETFRDDSFKKKPPKPIKSHLLEKEVSTIVDEKLDTIVSAIEQRLFNNLLKPTLNTIERNFSMSIDDLKHKINQINDTFVQTKQNVNTEIVKANYQTYGEERMFTNNNTRNKNKSENIHTVAEKLHEKLNEKERKLHKLQMETNLYLKEKKVFSPKNYY